MCQSGQAAHRVGRYRSIGVDGGGAVDYERIPRVRAGDERDARERQAQPLRQHDGVFPKHD